MCKRLEVSVTVCVCAYTYVWEMVKFHTENAEMQSSPAKNTVCIPKYMNRAAPCIW